MAGQWVSEGNLSSVVNIPGLSFPFEDGTQSQTGSMRQSMATLQEIHSMLCIRFYQAFR